MARVPTTIETVTPYKCVLNAESVGITPEMFFRLCADNPELRLELTARKEIVIMPPSGLESDWQSGEAFRQLSNWAIRDGAGMAFGPNAGFILPNEAIRSPDASWIRKEKWNALTPALRKKFGQFCPDFVIEVRSPNDTLSGQKAKMSEYLENGVELGLLIDPIKGRLYIYQRGRPPQCLERPNSVSADPELPGFKLNLTEIW